MRSADRRRLDAVAVGAHMPAFRAATPLDVHRETSGVLIVRDGVAGPDETLLRLCAGQVRIGNPGEQGPAAEPGVRADLPRADDPFGMSVRMRPCIVVPSG